MTWYNMFSYGEGNIIDFSDEKVTQLVGSNGAGKSSVSIILEELLYNKNSKGIKKKSILNRNCGSNKYGGTISFSKDGDSYLLQKDVASTAKVSLTKNGEDISGHTATQTYKLVEEIIGLDFKTFSKLVYQSMTSSLEFLTDTDSNRKKFLMGLFDMEEYEKIGENIKSALKDSKTQLSTLESAVNAAIRGLDSLEIPDVMEIPEVPDNSDEIQELVDQVITYSADIKNNEYENQRILENNRIDMNIHKLKSSAPEPQHFDKDQELRAATDEYSDLQADIRAKEREKQKLEKVSDKCPTCKQSIDIGNTKELLEEIRADLEKLSTKSNEIFSQLKVLKQEKQEAVEYENYLQKLEQLESRYDSSLSTEIFDVDEVSEDLRIVKARITELESEMKRAEKLAQSAQVTNAKREASLEAREKFTKVINEKAGELDDLKLTVADLTTLSDVFSSKGIIAHKIEAMIGSFEDLINKYLSELTFGRFLIEFRVEGTKLAVIIFDNGEEISPTEVSSGELNRINTATILAVRSLLSSINKNNINLLIMDEVISVLDRDGVLNLIDVLLEEHELNSVVVTHQYSHPLVVKMMVEKTEGISTIYKDI